MFYKRENGRIIMFSVENFDGATETEENIIHEFDGFYLESETKTETFAKRKKAFEEQQALNQLRARRETECFSIINRGQIWYGTLTNEQIAELNEWYRAWLNATDTKAIPDKPTWLK